MSTDMQDYLFVSGILRFLPSAVPQRSCIQVPIVNDTTVESNETLFIVLNTTDPAVVIPTGAIPLTIVDNDGELC